ncbi:MAG: TAT-variant-translocated molybdopterin oxidoreductase, partial [Opitutaceae bacterium]|nr:TAT-variant-translocated molybdopterin oxidoreductase [Opitutaceae bacterium]
MKRKFEHPAPSERELNGPQYWRSLDELTAAPGFKEQLAREFPEGASNLDGVDRRQFVKIMAASFALGGIGLAGCRRPEANILPYGKSVEGVIPGLPLYFATAMPLRKSAIPLLAETHQGRPTKLEGNPSYAPHGGASSLLAQASILDLYDPDRATSHTKGGATLANAAVSDLLAKIGADYGATQGAGLAFLAEESSSPTRVRLLGKLKKQLPRAIWAEYEPVQDDAPIAAARAAFGKDVKPLYHFAKAERIVSLDADFLNSSGNNLYFTRGFAKGRKVTKPSDPMNRLYVAESGYSLTGSMADHRLRLASSHMVALAAALANQATGTEVFAPLAAGLDIKPQWVEECAADLRAHQGKCLVVAGAHLPVEAHILAYQMNAALGNIGTTVDFVAVETSEASSIAALGTAIKSGSVKTLVILGGNPVYNAPADLDWAALQQSVAEVVRYSYYVDETSAHAGVQIAATHYLEAWGDARTVDGTIVPVQPMILPLFKGLTEIEVLARILGESNADPYTQVHTTISGLVAGDIDKGFRQFLHDGVLANSTYPVVDASFNPRTAGEDLLKARPASAVSAASLEVRFTTDHKMDDGRFANNGWLQECPDPITKIAWDNAILVSPRFARELGITPKTSLLQVARVEAADFVNGPQAAPMGEVTVNGRKVTGPVFVQPGLANYT